MTEKEDNEPNLNAPEEDADDAEDRRCDMKVVTEDRAVRGKGKMADADLQMLTGPFVKIESVEQLMELAKSAHDSFVALVEMIGTRMTQGKAMRIRDLRIREDYTWRKIAETCFEEWDDPCWSPPSNQIAGMALCQVAALSFGEDYMDKGTWN